MRVVVDACAGARLARALQTAGHEVVFVGDWPSDPGDEEILRYAFERSSVVLTRDKDFGTLAVLQEQPHCGIIRLVDLDRQQEARFCLEVLDKYSIDLLRGALITVDRSRVRVRI